MKVLIVGPIYNAKGGISQYINNIVKFNEYNNKVEYIKFNTNIKGNKAKKILYIPYMAIKYFNYIKRYNIKLVHINMATRGSFIRKSIVIILSKIFRKKIILHIHSGEFNEYYKNKCYKFIVKYILNIADSIIVLNESMKKEFINSFNINSIVLKNCINIKEKNVYNIENTEILFLGRITKKKGIFDLIEAINILININKCIYKFTIAGDGQLEEVNALINKYKLNKYVKLTGWVNEYEKESLLSKSAMMILPSYYEGVPISILEAMNYGVPVIGSNIDGIKSIITNESIGKIFELGNIHMLAEYIEELYSNKIMRQRYSMNSRNYLKENFSLKVYMENIYEIYNGDIKSN